MLEKSLRIGLRELSDRTFSRRSFSTPSTKNTVEESISSTATSKEDKLSGNNSQETSKSKISSGDMLDSFHMLPTNDLMEEKVLQIGFSTKADGTIDCSTEEESVDKLSKSDLCRNILVYKPWYVDNHLSDYVKKLNSRILKA